MVLVTNEDIKLEVLYSFEELKFINLPKMPGLKSEFELILFV